MSEEKNVVPQEQQAAALAPAQTPPAPEVKKETKAEKPSNCAGCNKSIKNKRWYYRNGKFFCTKRCWKTSVKKESQKEEPQGEKK